jgi:Tol biopolymer transport system component
MKGRSHGLGGLPGSGGARVSAVASEEGSLYFFAPCVVFFDLISQLAIEQPQRDAALMNANRMLQNVLRVSLSIVFLDGLPLLAEPDDWKTAQVKKTVLDTAANWKFPSRMGSENLVSMATSATPSGCHVAKVTGNVLDGFRVIHDGKAGPSYAEIAKETPVFSEDGGTLAYAARKGTEWMWVVNGVEGPSYSELTPTSFAFSADGKHHAYVVIPRFRQAALIVDGIVMAEGKWDGIMPWDAAPALSADGGRLAFVEVNRSQKLMRVNLDGKAGPWHPGISMLKSPGFGAFMFAQLQGAITEERARPQAFGFRFSPDGRRFAYGAFTDEHKSIMVVDGKKSEPHDTLGFDNLFSADGSLHAFMALDGKQRHIFATRAPPLPVDAMYDWSLTSSPDGRHLAFAGIREGKKAIWMDGKAVQLDVTMDDYRNTQPIIFSPDSRRLACCVMSQGSMYWVVDGKAGPGSKVGMGFNLSFSPDSQHFAYMLAKGMDGIAAIVVDGVERASYKPVTSGPVFRSDGVLEFIAVDSDGLCRFEITGY